MKETEFALLKNLCVERHIDADATDVLNIEQNTHLIVHGEVHLKCISCNPSVNTLLISGDTLYVEQTEANVAIGVCIVRNLSYGRYSLPSSNLRVVINCKEIHTTSGIRNCGIGVCGVRSITSDDFTSNCEVIDTPVDTAIKLETLYGSTKYTQDPVYYTKEEYAELKEQTSRELYDKMLWKFANERIASDYQSVVSTMENSDFGAYNESLCKLLNSLDTILDITTEESFGFCALKIFASVLKGLYETPRCTPSLTRIPAAVIAYKCFKRELSLFKIVPDVPLSLRLWLIYYDATDNFTLERKDPEQMSSLRDLGMNEEVHRHYHLPVGIDFSKECERYVYGTPYYCWHDVNRLVKHNFVYTGTVYDAECCLVPNLSTIYDLPNRVPEMFRGRDVKVLVVENHHNLCWRRLSSIPGEDNTLQCHYLFFATDDCNVF